MLLTGLMVIGILLHMFCYISVSLHDVEWH